MAHIEINLHKLKQRKNHFDILNKILGQMKMIIECIWKHYYNSAKPANGDTGCSISPGYWKSWRFLCKFRLMSAHWRDRNWPVPCFFNEQTYSSSMLPETYKSPVTSNGLICLVHFDSKHSPSLFSLSRTSCLGILAPDTSLGLPSLPSYFALSPLLETS